MTVSMRVMSAGSGYRYLLKSVAAGDGNRALSTPLTRYYAEKGTPPGFWLGSGVASLAGGQLSPGDVVTEDQLRRLLGEGRDPVSGDVLGKPFYVFKGDGEGDRRHAVAGYDYTFSVPKSVSVLWAVADAETKAVIVDAHHAAIAEVVDLMERDVAATRIGSATRNGAVAQVEVTGLIATAYDHYDSRSGDPQLHTHVVVSNKVRTVYDGKWRSLDGRPLHAATVALSEHYNGLLADQLSRRLGVGWELRDKGRDRNPGWEIRGVGSGLVEAFSNRVHAIDQETERLVEAYRQDHGRRPSATTVLKLRAQATLSTRPFKTLRSLADLTADWRKRATAILGYDSGTWATHLIRGGREQAFLRADDISPETVGEFGRAVVEAVGERRSTWRLWNLHAEASRQIMGLRFTSSTDREAIVGLIVDDAEARSLRLTPPELAVTPEVFQRADTTTRFRPAASTVYTSPELLAAEDRLLDFSRDNGGPTIAASVVEHYGNLPDHSGRKLTGDQLAALTSIAVSGRKVDVLLGPAGTGKTTAMSALRAAWETVHGPGSVVGLAPSAAAAQVLAEDLDIRTENTAKWLHDHATNGRTFSADQLVIIDEASLAGTFTLDRITHHADHAGAKVLLVGDWAQLAAVEAGGAFGMLVRDRDQVPELSDVHRFHHAWERHATLQLRVGDTTVIDTYETEGRLHEGDTETMLDTAYQAWIADIAEGRSSVLVAESAEATTALNTRARLDRIVAGHVTSSNPMRLHDGTEASTGDLVITRRNDRKLNTGWGWVKNGDRWTITATNPDGSIRIRPPGAGHGQSVTLPADYVVEHVELGYAVTVHRSQGVTVDTAHAIVQPSMTREALYVAMTRGRSANTAYIAIDEPDTEAHQHHEDPPTGRSVLYGVLHHVGAELSAHETITAEHELWAGIDQLAAEYETIAADAQRERWNSLLRTTALTPDQADAATGSEAFGPLTSLLRRVEAYGYDPDRMLRSVVTERPLDGVDDIAAILHHRLSHAIPPVRPTTRRQPDLIAGLIPRANGPMADDARTALDERATLIEQRARALAETALADDAAWTLPLGTEPNDQVAKRQWSRAVTTLAAYRDRYHITSDDPLGPAPTTKAQEADHALAQQALRKARTLQATEIYGRASLGTSSPRQSGPTL